MYSRFGSLCPFSCRRVMVEVVEVVLLPMISKKLMPVAIMAESLLCALAGMRLALFAALFMVMAPLRRRA